MDGWDDTPEWEIPEEYVPQSKVSVVIAARNEAKFISECIESIIRNKYPEHLLEIIVVNDHSEDDTKEVIEKFDHPQLILINLNGGSGKKKALEQGIKKAKGTLIACTDADSIVPENWLMSFVSFYEKNDSKCIAGPISYRTDKSLLQRFQFLDALNNMCVTANGITKQSYFMANGANLFFSKSVFEEIGGYSKNSTYASGDDMFLIQEIANKYTKGVSFLKSIQATVKTQPETTFQALKNQRTRWATKSKAYSNKNIMRIQGFVFCFVVVIIVNLLMSPFGVGLSLFGFLFALFIKWTMDYLYLSKMSDFFEERDPLKSFFGASIGFIIYILFAGWKALRPTSYTWKGRRTK